MFRRIGRHTNQQRSSVSMKDRQCITQGHPQATELLCQWNSRRSQAALMSHDGKTQQLKISNIMAAISKIAWQLTFEHKGSSSAAAEGRTDSLYTNDTMLLGVSGRAGVHIT